MVISKRNYIAHVERLSLSSVMGDRGTHKRSRRSSYDSHSPIPSSSSATSSNNKKSNVVAAVSKNCSSMSPVRNDQYPEVKSQSPVPLYPQSDIIKQQEEQRFTDENGTIYPKLGDKIKVQFDEKDWYDGIVKDFNIETSIVALVYDDGGDFEMIDFPDKVFIKWFFY